MTNQNQEAFEQMKRFTKAAKNFYGNNYRPGSVNPQYQTKFFLNEDYIPLAIVGKKIFNPIKTNIKNISNFAYNNLRRSADMIFK